jgi:hypothetical protein
MFSWKTLEINDDLINLIKVLPVSVSFLDIAALVEYCDHIPWPENYGSYGSEELE